METIEDIVREMRERSEAMEIHGTPHGIKVAMQEFADRIESAVKSLEADRDNWRRQALDEDARANATHKDSLAVGDMAAMRKALESALPIMRDCPFTHYNTTEVDKVVRDMEAALSATPRNVDRFNTLHEVIAYWREHGDEIDMPLLHWLFAEAKGETK